MGRLRLVLTAAAVAAVVVVAVALALLRVGGGGVAVDPFEADATLGPPAALFGDRLEADVRIVLDRRIVDPDSVIVSTDFGALSAPAVSVPRRERAGDAVVLRYRYGLFCLRDECRVQQGLRELRFRPALVRYELQDGTSRTARLEWPAVTIGSRLGSQPVGTADWRIRDDPLPPPTYRVRPSLAAAVGFALAALLALVGVFLIASVVRAFLRQPPVDELAGLPPLERALRVLRLALANGGPPEHRRALDRLARELRRAGLRDLAGEARKLAWQRPGPDRDEANGLAGRVAGAIGATA
jgi:hypothetical protein